MMTAAVEREGRLGHALVAYGKQTLHAVLLLRAEKLHGVLTVLLDRPSGVAAARDLLPEGFAERP